MVFPLHPFFRYEYFNNAASFKSFFFVLMGAEEARD